MYVRVEIILLVHAGCTIPYHLPQQIPQKHPHFQRGIMRIPSTVQERIIQKEGKKREQMPEILLCSTYSRQRLYNFALGGMILLLAVVIHGCLSWTIR